jgi:hypothetical protein
VARYQRLTSDAVIQEMSDCNRIFYSMPGVVSRVWSCLWQWRKPLINLITNLSTRNNSRVEVLSYAKFQKHLASLPVRHGPRPAERHQDLAPVVAETQAV